MNQIRQFWGMETGVAKRYTHIVYEGHYLSNHHPVLLTYFYGIFFKFGEFIGHMDVGAFLLSLVTLLINSFCMAYALSIIKKYVHSMVYYFLLIFSCIFPIYIIYSYACCKDNLFASVMLIFIVQLLEIAWSEGAVLSRRSFVCGHFFTTMLIPFLKSQGYIVVVVTLLLFVVFDKRTRKKTLINIGLVTAVYVVLFTHILMPALKIAPVGRQEMLSLPFQQTAYYVQQFSSELTVEEYDAINAILPVDEMAELYKPNLADPVKFRFNQSASKEDLLRYFAVWMQQLLKHPGAYFEAFFRMTDGYYYWGYPKLEFDLTQSHDLLDVHFEKDDGWLSRLLDGFMSLPVIRWMLKISFMTWLAIFTGFYCIYRRDKKSLLVMAPVILSFLVCLMSPWNGVIRYVLPVIYAFPVMVCLLLKRDEAL